MLAPMPLPKELLRHIPSVNALLTTSAVELGLRACPRWAIVLETRSVVEEIRQGTIALVTEKALVSPWHEELGTEVMRRAEQRARYSLQRVINATGVVLHTNMGRALLAPRAVDHMVEVATRYSNLELDLEHGERGSRYEHVARLICELSGAEDAIVVNNNAAAVVLCLSELAQGKEVVIARGELVEIGGSFRIPEIMETSGCKLREIGTTNRCHLRDYEQAIGEDTGLLLKVHTSNYRIIGFTKSIAVAELVPMAQAAGLPIMHDLGAGCLVDLRQFGLPAEPTVQEALADGADVVTFSGDKLLGGPQIGIVAGKKHIIDRLKNNPLLRALRVDKLTLAALEATLRIYRDAREPSDEIPALRMLALGKDEIGKRAEAMVAALKARGMANTALRIIDGDSQVGAGSAPEASLATKLIALRPAAMEVATIDAELRRRRPAVMARLHDGEVLVDLRTVLPDEEELLADALLHVLR